MNLAPVIGSFATGTYIVTRRGPAVVGTDGRVSPATATTLSIVASVFPTSGRDLARLPEGDRQVERKTLYTTTPLKAKSAPDVVTIGSADYEVEHVEDFVNFGGDFYTVVVRRVGN